MWLPLRSSVIPDMKFSGDGVLVQAPDQVRHSRVEVVRVDGGHVEADVAHVASDRGGLRTRHALEHLEFDGVVHAAGTREFVGEGDVEDVVAGHAHAQAVQVLAPQDPVEDPLVVRVGVLLRRAHRHGPSRELAVHLFHLGGSRP